MVITSKDDDYRYQYNFIIHSFSHWRHTMATTTTARRQQQIGTITTLRQHRIAGQSNNNGLRHSPKNAHLHESFIHSFIGVFAAACFFTEYYIGMHYISSMMSYYSDRIIADPDSRLLFARSWDVLRSITQKLHTFLYFFFFFLLLLIDLNPNPPPFDGGSEVAGARVRLRENCAVVHCCRYSGKR